MKKYDLETVSNWHEALNTKNKQILASLVTKNVGMSGPKGHVEGVDIMLDWVDRANIALEPISYFQFRGTVVVEGCATWYDIETGAKIGAALVATVFILANGFITTIKRYDNLSEALQAARLTEKHRVDYK